jgi:hypothetical protein
MGEELGDLEKTGCVDKQRQRDEGEEEEKRTQEDGCTGLLDTQ